MPDNLLQVVQTACDELGLQRPSVVASSTDLQIRQLFALINRDLRELQQNYDWTALQAEFTLAVSPPIVTTGSTTVGSPVITGIPADLTNVNAGWIGQGQGIPVNARVQASGAGSVTLSEPASATAVGVPFTLSQDTYFGPPDFDRFINQTWWDRTNRWALLGPDSPQMDQWHRSGIVTTGPRRHFRQVGFSAAASGANQNYRLWPPPGALDAPLEIAFEYITKNTVYTVPGVTFTPGDFSNDMSTDFNVPQVIPPPPSVPQDRFIADTDVCVLDSNMLVLGVKWRMWQIKGFDYSDLQQEYVDYINRRYANDGGAKTLSLSRGRYGLGPAITQDGFFPGPVGPNSS